ncbi:ribonuclease D [Lysobacter soyae]|uniref:Ribonuclease D n=1 Tax=Lysobacter soyae TaxID=2764185 RepID=A0ABX8WMS9_9GAMM|nr:ribonuclease D [Lysobacter sp. CJ11]QYR52415.1 ribonuclease D [Lysobacter sp. CJ11]
MTDESETTAPIWVDSPEALQSHIAKIDGAVGIDTEFVRERTFWPKLALVQIATGDDILLVDCKVPGVSAALAPLLSNHAILKIMHSPGEDFVAFLHGCGVAPYPVFDTQLAAALAGLGHGMGYARLMQTLFDIEIDKGETRSDWMRRPLSAAQLKYAVEDVRYLHEAHRVLAEKLHTLDRTAWMEQESEAYFLAQSVDEPERWAHLGARAGQRLDRDGQTRLLRLMRWREVRARARDLPKNWVLPVEAAVELAESNARSESDVTHILLRHPRAPKNLAAPMLAAMHQPLEDEAQMPLLMDDRDRDKARIRAWQNRVSEIAAELGVEDGVIASRKVIQAYLDEGEWPESVTAWRKARLDAGAPPK